MWCGRMVLNQGGKRGSSKLGVRFAVGDGKTRRASLWECWITAPGKNDVYLANRSLGRGFHLSLHKDGRWHFAFDRHYLATHGRAHEWPTRFIDEWTRPSDVMPGGTVACRIITPMAAVNSVLSDADIPNTIWIDSPAEGRAVEVAIIITAAPVPINGWPGRTSMHTGFVGQVPLGNGDTCWIVSRVIDMPTLPRTQTFPRGRYFNSRARSDVAGSSLRGMFFSTHSDGSRVIYDLVMQPQAPQ